MHLGFGIRAPCMGPWDPWPKNWDLGPLHGPLGPLAQKNIIAWNAQTDGGAAFSHFPDLRIYGFPRPPDPFHETRSGLLYRKFTIWDLDPCMGREKLNFMFSNPAK